MIINYQKCFFLMFVVLVLLGVLTGCQQSTPAEPSPILWPTPSLISVPSLTPVPRISPVFVPTIPSLSLDKEEQMVNLLQSKVCTLPCYLGIMPGTTSLGQARTILENIGAIHKSDYQRNDGAIEYVYAMKIVELSAITETPEYDSSVMAIYHDVSLITDNGIVQIVEVSVGTMKLLAKFREYWSRYSAGEIFLQLGRPEQLYIDTTTPVRVENGRTLLVVYGKLGVVGEIYGTGLENNICPESEATFISLRLSLFNTNSPLSIYSDGRVPPTDRDVWLPVNEVLGVDEIGFYDQVISDPKACFIP